MYPVIQWILIDGATYQMLPVHEPQPRIWSVKMSDYFFCELRHKNAVHNCVFAAGDNTNDRDIWLGCGRVLATDLEHNDTYAPCT